MDAAAEPPDVPLAPLCEVCGSLDRMRPVGSPDRARWECPACGAVRLA